MQVSPADCTGCELCVNACPDGALTPKPVAQVTELEAANWDFMRALPERGNLFEKATVRGSQFTTPLMEFSGACEGCGETPYVKLLTQLFGRRMVVANATGCSSIWGGSAPANPCEYCFFSVVLCVCFCAIVFVRVCVVVVFVVICV
jgi:pyruvate-ferredoxin/flavodoxin oxidoreductase